METNMRLKGRRIFILEDDANNLSIALIILKQEGATVRFDRYGHHTIERLKQFQPVDLILLDIMLPDGVTGYEVLESIRAVPELSRIPVAAVTASDPGKVTAKLKTSGFDGFIGKPVRFQTFGAYVAAIIQGEDIWNTSAIR